MLGAGSGGSRVSGELGGWGRPGGRAADVGVLPTALTGFTFDAVEFARDLLGWAPDEKQALVLRSSARRVILNCSRQWGKTTLAATKILHMALTRPGVLILVVSENLGQTAEFFGKIDFFLSGLGLRARGEPGKRIARRLELTESRIVGIASREEAGRGYTADLVFVDEAARIPDEAIDAIKPTIAVRRGDFWMASTPRGRRGRFFQAWTYSEGPDLLKVSAPASENPRIPAEFVEECRLEHGDDYIDQEFECKFIENGVNLMSFDEVDRLAHAFVPRRLR